MKQLRSIRLRTRGKISGPHSRAVVSPATVYGHSKKVYLYFRKKYLYVRNWPNEYPKSYISLRHRKSRILVNNAALRLWTSAARRNPAFAGIYSTGELSRYGEGPLEPAKSIEQLVRNAQEFGIGLMEDVLSESQLRVVQDEIDSIRNWPSQDFCTGVQYHTREASPRLREIFEEIVLEIGNRVHGSDIRPDFTAWIQRFELKTTDNGDKNTILHIDRWFPCIKIFYYPHPVLDVDHSPYGYVPGSHRIGEEYLTYVRESFSRFSHHQQTAFEMRNPTTRSEHPVLTKGNSLLVTYSNGLHRRIPFGPTAMPGAFRESIRFGFDNAYTRKNLLFHLIGR